MADKIDKVLHAQKARLMGEAPVILPGATDPVMLRPLWDGKAGDEDCPDCRGAGCFRLDLHPSHPRFGKLFACECRVKVRSLELARELSANSSLAEADLKLTWADLIVVEDSMRQAANVVRDILLRGWGWVYLSGPNGPGKTQLLKIVVAETIRQKKAATFSVYLDMLDHLRAGYERKDYDRRVDLWRGVSVLCIDEFARAKDSEWSRDAQVKVFNHRNESALHGQTVTIFTSNFPHTVAEDWLADRFEDSRYRIVEVTGSSLRPLMGDGNETI